MYPNHYTKLKSNLSQQGMDKCELIYDLSDLTYDCTIKIHTR